MFEIPQEYSTFWSFEQKEELDDFLPSNVSVVYPAFEAFPSPEGKCIKTSNSAISQTFISSTILLSNRDGNTI